MSTLHSAAHKYDERGFSPLPLYLPQCPILSACGRDLCFKEQLGRYNINAVSTNSKWRCNFCEKSTKLTFLLLYYYKMYFRTLRKNLYTLFFYWCGISNKDWKLFNYILELFYLIQTFSWIFWKLNLLNQIRLWYIY